MFEINKTDNKLNFENGGINLNFVQDDISISYKNVLRGVHGDSKTWKLVSCLQESFYNFFWPIDNPITSLRDR